MPGISGQVINQLFFLSAKSAFETESGCIGIGNGTCLIKYIGIDACQFFHNGCVFQVELIFIKDAQHCGEGKRGA
ncbi:hypothetical protein D3C85_1514120 [compost metagenome]